MCHVDLSVLVPYLEVIYAYFRFGGLENRLVEGGTDLSVKTSSFSLSKK
jgi:hypothetical protein